MKNNFLIYGANGYTGELITRMAVERGMRPIVAGRNEAAIKALAEAHGLEHRVFSLDDTAKLDTALNEVALVLHCAGPFSLTSRQMGEACLRTGTHYTDITGEIAVFEACAAGDQKAKDAGIMVMPGVGFDVVPSDCLARRLKDRLPSATNLMLAFYGKSRISHGTQATMTMNIDKGGAVRRDGKIKPVPAAWRTREIDFGEGVVKLGVTIPWGDVSTAFYSTGIPNIEVYTVAPPSALRLMKLSRFIGPLLASGPVQRYLQGKIPPGGPNDAERARGKTLLWGEASDDAGNRIEERLTVPEGYTTTALAALEITRRILAGDLKPGFQTPSMAYGPDLIDAAISHAEP
ncbi:MAG: saccharopine dehydrogenase NADP-binding domain-containing protein [Acidobacteria bacterium]|nr:saccharopine dehydrogenase NADP-binding domain-containing protein [Acidobacteriota bacterium]